MKEDIEYYTQEWCLSTYNSGWEITYVSTDGIVRDIPFENDDNGHSQDLNFLRYVIGLHNENLKKGGRVCA